MKLISNVTEKGNEKPNHSIRECLECRADGSFDYDYRSFDWLVRPEG